MFVNLSIILGISATLLIALNKNFDKGLGFAVFLLVSMPVELFIETGGALPILSIYRAIIIILLLMCFFKKGLMQGVSNLPFIHLIMAIIVTRSISLLLSFDVNVSLKPYLSFIIETVILYIIMANIIKDKISVDIVIFSIAIATVIVAALGVIERYTDFNPVDYIPITERLLSQRHDPTNADIVYSVYNHPILLGAGLAMGWPVCLAVMDRQNNSTKKRCLWWCGAILVAACQYFTLSRGPWLAFILAGVVLILLRYPRIKKKAAILLLITAALLVLRPGIYDTIFALAEETTDSSTLEGGSFQYRFELWKIAYAEVIKAPERFAFGYGDDASTTLGLTGWLSYRPERFQTFTSWDNDLAANLLEMGFCGLTLIVALYVSMLRFLIHVHKVVEAEDKRMVAALIASVVVYIFMTTNVRMFAPQVNFLLWINISIGWAIYKKHISKKFQSRISRAY